jgi:hypothetical protein
MDDEPLTEDATAGDLPVVRMGLGGSAVPPVESGDVDYSGTLMGDYRLVRRIAVGGMGAVYEAIQLKLDRKVALKILTGELESKPEFLQRFEREAKSAATLNHPNIVQVYDFGRAAGHYYLIMEFVEGEDLADYVTNHGKLGVSEALSIAEQTARGLKAALEKSIIHRDIKPANLMRTTDGKIKVSDLGLAKKLNDATEVTATGVGIGSPHFLAPEQADDARHVDHRADMYALGITLLYLLTGKRPYDGGSAFSVVIAHANKSLPTGLELGTELEPNVEQLIRRMAAKKPADRYADYDLLLEDIERVKAGGFPSLPDGTVPDPTGSGRWLKIGSLVAVGVVVAGIGIWWQTHHRSRTGPVTGTNGPTVAAVKPAGFGDPGNGDDGGFGARRGPPPEGGPGQGGFGGQPGRGRFTQDGPDDGPPGLVGPGGLELPQMAPPDRNPLKDGPLAAMLAEADKYAADHKTEYMSIIWRYDQILEKFGNAPEADGINRKAEYWRQAQMDAAEQEIDKDLKKTRELLSQGKRGEVREMWMHFPANLRNREIDSQIRLERDKILRGAGPPGPPNQ